MKNRSRDFSCPLSSVCLEALLPRSSSWGDLRSRTKVFQRFGGECPCPRHAEVRARNISFASPLPPGQVRPRGCRRGKDRGLQGPPSCQGRRPGVRRTRKDWILRATGNIADRLGSWPLLKMRRFLLLGLGRAREIGLHRGTASTGPYRDPFRSIRVDTPFTQINFP